MGLICHHLGFQEADRSRDMNKGEKVSALLIFHAEGGASLTFCTRWRPGTAHLSGALSASLGDFPLDSS